MKSKSHLLTYFILIPLIYSFPLLSTTITTGTLYNKNVSNENYFASNETLYSEFESAFTYNMEVIKNSTIYNTDFNQYIVNYIETDSSWPDFCRTGQKQSPINIPLEYDNETSANVFEITEFNFNISNSVYRTIDPNYNETQNHFSAGGVIDITNTGSIKVVKNNIPYIYDLNRLVMKYPSEHTLNGVQYDLELQIEFTKNTSWVTALISKGLIVDPDTNNKLIISNLFVKNGNDNVMLRELRISTLGPILNFDLTEFIPIYSPYFFYEGSITLPSCTENVNWIINRKEFSTSASQMSYFISWINGYYPVRGNSRSVKSINNRKIYFQLNVKPDEIVSGSFKLVFVLTTLIILFFI